MTTPVQIPRLTRRSRKIIGGTAGGGVTSPLRLRQYSPTGGWFPKEILATGPTIVLGLVLSLGLLAQTSSTNSLSSLPLEVSATRVSRHARIEFTAKPDLVFENPYDPDEVDFRIELTSPGGKRIVLPGFYFQPFERQQIDRGGQKNEWLYPVGLPVWKARFAPLETGTYRGSAVLKTPAGSLRSAELIFECTPGNDRGFVRVSTRDKRYLEFDDGAPFFAIGQNVAFVTDTYRTMEMLRAMGENGANFARVWACSEDWAMAIEARKSAWGRSWNWHPPIVIMPDRESYHSGRLCLQLAGEAGAKIDLEPCRQVALRPNTRYRFAVSVRTEKNAGLTVDIQGLRPLEGPGKWSPFSCEFTTASNQWWLANPCFRLTAKGAAWLRDLSLKEAGGGPELLGEAEPNRPILGVYNQPDCFMMDQVLAAAEQYGIYLQVVLLTRDHYMSLLAYENSGSYQRALRHAKMLARYAAARWGYSTHLATWEYFNEIDPGLPTERFYTEIGRALDEFDANRHLRSTSAWHSPAPHYAYPAIDVRDQHYYLRPPEGEIWRDEVAAIQARWKIIEPQAREKPAMFSEFGITDAQWQRAPQLDQDRNFAHWHNALWASTLSGYASTVCHWYWDDIQKRNLYRLYQPVSRFVADIPFTTDHLRPAAAVCEPPLRVMGLQGDHGAYLWLADREATWWKIAVEQRPLVQQEKASITLSSLPPGRYQVEWWETQRGSVIQRTECVLDGKELKIEAPPFTGDLALKVRKQ